MAKRSKLDHDSFLSMAFASRLRHTVYQQHGCYCHGHLCYLSQDKQGNFKIKNLSNEKTMSELQAETRKNTEYLKIWGTK